jgi:hypothetical protein
MADPVANKSEVDVTTAPAKILSVLKNGKVFVVTEAKVYEFMDGKLRPVTFADVEYAAILAGSAPLPNGAVPSAPPPAPAVPPTTPAPAATSGLFGTTPAPAKPAGTP